MAEVLLNADEPLVDEPVDMALYREAIRHVTTNAKTIEQLHTENRKLRKVVKVLQEDNTTLAAKCKEHFNAAQNLMRYQLQIPDSLEESKAAKVIRGQVAGSDNTFSIGPE